MYKEIIRSRTVRKMGSELNDSYPPDFFEGGEPSDDPWSDLTQEEAQKIAQDILKDHDKKWEEYAKQEAKNAALFEEKAPLWFKIAVCLLILGGLILIAWIQLKLAEVI